MERIKKDWLFGDHSQTQVYKWISTLKYFLFFRANGGHANDGDYLELRIRFIEPNDQRILLDALCLPNKVFNDHTKLTLNQPFSKFDCTISKLGLAVTVIGTNGNPYKMDDREYNLCVEFEKIIDSIHFSGKVLHDHSNMASCITLDRYADYFKSNIC